MNLIAIDATTEHASVALKVGNAIDSLEQNAVRQHTQFLLPMIQTLMDKAAITWSAVEGIVFGAGPGSFTGLRIACSMAKALAYAQHLPIYPVNSMAALAYQVQKILPDECQTQGILTILDARMQEVYWAYFSADRQPEGAIHVSKVAEIVLPKKEKVVLAGMGFETYADQWRPDLLEQITTQYAMVPCAASLIEMVISEGIQPTTAAEALPLYIRNQVTHSRGVHG